MARRNQLPFILTEDLQHTPTIEGVRYVNPFDPAFDFVMLEF